MYNLWLGRFFFVVFQSKVLFLSGKRIYYSETDQSLGQSSLWVKIGRREENSKKGPKSLDTEESLYPKGCLEVFESKFDHSLWLNLWFWTWLRGQIFKFSQRRSKKNVESTTLIGKKARLLGTILTGAVYLAGACCHSLTREVPTPFSEHTLPVVVNQHP